MSIRQLLLAFVLCVGLVSPVSAADGTYISSAIGDKRLVSFTTLTVGDQKVPAGTNITYAFAGSGSNYEQWSTPQAVSESLALASVPELANSKYAKVRIVMSASATESPSLGGFTLTYEVLGDTLVAAPMTTSNTSSGSQSAVTSQANTTVNLSNSAQVKTTPAALATTGGNLWFNLGVALAVSILIGWWLLSRRTEAPAIASRAVPPTAS